MTEPESRSEIAAFYKALSKRDDATLERYLDDNVVWSIGGPVELLPYCGTYHGKAAVLDLVSQKIHKSVGAWQIVPDHVLIDGNLGAAIGRLHGKKDKDISISYRIGQFFRFKNGKVIEYRSVIDTFDAVEQVIGQRIEVGPGLAPGELDSDLFAV